jgi:type I restriction enzyme R subunit
VANIPPKACDNDSYEEDVEGIDTKELYDNPQRLEMIARYIVNIHDTKTRNREFTAMFCVSSVETLTQYYDILKRCRLKSKLKMKHKVGYLNR